MHHFKPKRLQLIMSSTPVTSPIKASIPNAPVKATKAGKEKGVAEPKEKEKTKKEKAKKEEEPKQKEEPKPKQKVKKEEPKQKAIEEQPPTEPTQPTEKKQRAAGLPAKYGKFIQYSYYLIRAINNNALQANCSVLIDEDQFIAAAHIFDSINIQQDFVNAFLENKNITKEMRAHVADKKKAEIAAVKNAEKAAKEAAKNAEKLAKAEAKKAAKPPKPPKTTAAKAKSKKATAGEPDLVTSLVALANSTVDSAPIGGDDAATPNSGGKPVTVNAENEEEEEELDVRLITIHGKDYLIDDTNNLYDYSTHSVVGTWDKDKDIIVQP